MQKETLVRNICRVLASGLAGTTLAASCSPAEIDLARQGIDVILQSVQDDDHHEDISFGDWLLDEIGD